MEKKYELCLEVLRRLQKERVLEEIIIVGSWCIYFYREYFSKTNYSSSIRTRDIDFLVPLPLHLKKKVDIPELLKDMGYIIDFHRSGYIRLLHPELIIEFLVPEKGRGVDKPYPLPQLGVNAQRLRFLDFLAQNTIVLKTEELTLNLPHPAAFGLHKLIVSSRRTKEEKRIKEREEAVKVLNALIDQGEEKLIKDLFDSMLAGWKKKILNILKKFGGERILNILEE
ncbi:MAG: GSU2403 family nucleotidyltransferase fold protein [bacterium]